MHGGIPDVPPPELCGLRFANDTMTNSFFIRALIVSPSNPADEMVERLFIVLSKCDERGNF
jgi:hypothetical protein